MVKLDVLPDENTVRRFKGKTDFYLWKGIPVARAWPNIQRSTVNPENVNQTLRMAHVASLADSLTPHLRATYGFLTRDTAWTWRDYFISMYLGGVPYPDSFNDQQLKNSGALPFTPNSGNHFWALLGVSFLDVLGGVILAQFDHEADYHLFGSTAYGLVREPVVRTTRGIDRVGCFQWRTPGTSTKGFGIPQGGGLYAWFFNPHRLTPPGAQLWNLWFATRNPADSHEKVSVSVSPVFGLPGPAFGDTPIPFPLGALVPSPDWHAGILFPQDYGSPPYQPWQSVVWSVLPPKDDLYPGLPPQKS